MQTIFCNQSSARRLLQLRVPQSPALLYKEGLLLAKRYSVEEISPIQIGHKSGNKGKRKCRRSEVLTASPMKDILSAKEAARTRRDAKGTGTRKPLNQLSQAKPKSAKKEKGVQCRLNFRLHCSSRLCVSLIQCRSISLR